MEKLIQQQLTAELRQDVLKAINESRDKLRAVSVGLSDMQKNGVRSMAEGREGMARLISKIASAHINSLARENDPSELESRLQYDASLEDMRQAVMALHEMVEETQLANSMDIMTMVDKFAANLETSRKGNAALDLSMREVDEYNKRFGDRIKAKTPETPTTPPAANESA